MANYSPMSPCSHACLKARTAYTHVCVCVCLYACLYCTVCSPACVHVGICMDVIVEKRQMHGCMRGAFSPSYVPLGTVFMCSGRGLVAPRRWGGRTRPTKPRVSEPLRPLPTRGAFGPQCRGPLSMTSQEKVGEGPAASSSPGLHSPSCRPSELRVRLGVQAMLSMVTTLSGPLQGSSDKDSRILGVSWGHCLGLLCT